MVYSMTGFGRGEAADEKRRITVEIKSVNNRFLDLSMKMPRKCNPLEAKIREELKKYLQRGKVDLFITCEDLTDSGEKVCYNRALAEEYRKYLREMAEEFGLEDDIRLSTFARLPDVLTLEDTETEDDSLWPLLQQALDQAGEAVSAARAREGEFLCSDLLKKLDDMTEAVDFIGERSPQIVAEYQTRLSDKIHELLGEAGADEARIAQEVTMYADKICVDEEMVRLRSHIRATRQTLESASAAPRGAEGIGRRLDFLAQEMNREANTILSKTDDVEISAQGIQLKTDIEKVREQIQNLE